MLQDGGKSSSSFEQEGVGFSNCLGSPEIMALRVPSCSGMDTPVLSPASFGSAGNGERCKLDLNAVGLEKGL